MKVNLLTNDPKGVRPGWVNIDASGGPGAILGSVVDLGHSVDLGEAEEIYSSDVLDKLPLEQGKAALQNWLACLRFGGTLTVAVLDLREACRLVLDGALTPEGANQTIFSRRSAWPVAYLAQQITERGGRVVSKSLEGMRAVVVAERVDPR